jgi:hypothetical protein
MIKYDFRIFIVTLFLLFTIFFLSACTSEESLKVTSTGSEISAPSDASNLSNLQVTACNAAHEGKTCDTKLEDLGIVTKKECCSKLNKCC